MMYYNVQSLHNVRQANDYETYTNLIACPTPRRNSGTYFWPSLRATQRLKSRSWRSRVARLTRFRGGWPIHTLLSLSSSQAQVKDRPQRH